MFVLRKCTSQSIYSCQMQQHTGCHRHRKMYPVLPAPAQHQMSNTYARAYDKCSGEAPEVLSCRHKGGDCRKKLDVSCAESSCPIKRDQEHHGKSDRAEDIQNAKASDHVNSLGYSSHSLAVGKPDRHMDPFRIEFSADGVDELSSHEGEEFIICIAGEVELTYGVEKTILKAGDTAYYNSVVKHGLRAVGGKPASIYGVVFMPF